MTWPRTDVTILTSSNDDITKNTWSSSRDSDGHLIFFPIIVGCRDCTSLLTIINGIDGFFNTVFKFPPIPFPRFPKIPKLHIPCIFFCHKGHRHHKPKPPVYNEPDKENEGNDEDDTSTKTSKSMSSESSCEAATASVCTVYSTLKVDGTKTTTMTSTSCSAETKCSATGHSTTTATTSSSTPESTRYHITANRRAGMIAINALTARLKVETDPTTLWVIGGPRSTGGWTQDLTLNQAELYKKEPTVASVRPVADYKLSHEISRVPSAQEQRDSIHADLIQTVAGSISSRSRPKRDGVPIQQTTEDDPLKIVSQPFGALDLSLIATYSHQQEEKGARVYVLDSGFDITHPLYDTLVQESGIPDWLWPGSADDADHLYLPYFYEGPGTHTDGDVWDSHGTAMACRVVGSKLGVSKKASLTIVRLPRSIVGAREVRISSFKTRVRVIEDALNLVIEDVESRGIERMSVVSISGAISAGLTSLPVEGDDLWGVYQGFQALAELGVPIVVSAGNGNGFLDAQNRKIWPITSEYVKWATVLPLIVVGGSDKDGTFDVKTRWQPAAGFPQSGVRIFAPSFTMEQACSVALGTYHQVGGGTSAAAAMTSGLVAYFLNIKSHHDKIMGNLEAINLDGEKYAWPKAIKKYVEQMTFQRRIGLREESPFIITNGENPFDNQGHAVCRPRGNFAGNSKRQTGGECIRQDDADASSSIASLSTASLASASSASLASASSASLASASSANLASISSASLAAISSVSLLSVSASIASVASAIVASISSASMESASSELTATKTSSSAAPTPTDKFSGYIGSTCGQGNVSPMGKTDTEKVVDKLCDRSYTWETKNKAPRERQGTSGSIAEVVLGQDGIKTLGRIWPTEDVGSACASGIYPRALTNSECYNAYHRLSNGRSTIFGPQDHNGCMNFLMIQGPSKLPLETTSTPPPQTSATPPPPAPEPSPPPTTIGDRYCYKPDEFDDQQPILPGLAQEAIQDMCSRYYTWQDAKKPANGESGKGVALACKVNKYPRTLYEDVCAYAFTQIKDSSCKNGGMNVATAINGCFYFTMKQVQNFN
ncbi:uncharacterized protein RCO7_05435 [Rhynchosporium graminicola]|uniref:Peptidase S8/S53 domain-containing protein n=1 Tax=Rhynchosporium graminicola TaxID=2792576 RepID=A0A1E1KV03_9HELO|nr:uncharacterized protein RCO7_05435 [Rhynchosporium commune]